MSHTEGSAETSGQDHQSRVRLSLATPCGGQAQHTKTPVPLRTTTSRALPALISACGMGACSCHLLCTPTTRCKERLRKFSTELQGVQKPPRSYLLKGCHILHVTWIPSSAPRDSCAEGLSPAQHPQVRSLHFWLQQLQGDTDSSAADRKTKL